MKVRIDPFNARIRAPVVSSHGSVSVRELVVLRLEDSEGNAGVGEAAPLHSYDGVTIEDARIALEDCRAALEAAHPDQREEVLAQCTRLAVLPQAVAAVDLALWDLTGRRAGRPVWQLLGAKAAAPVQVNYTVASADRAGAAREAGEARAAGFHCVKAKVGIGDDAGRLAAIRAVAGPTMAIRIDANGAWDVEEAHAALRVLEPVGLECCEEPVHGLDQIEQVAAASDVAIALDESAALPGALDRARCDAVCLKISRCGGITGVLESARRARSAGYLVYLASTYDGPVGIAAALHAAAVIGPDLPCGLATLGMFADRNDPLPASQGVLAPPAGPGLGDGLHDWYLS